MARARARAMVVVGIGCSLLLVGLTVATFGQEADEPISSVVQKAGNADDDGERLAMLRQLRQRPDLDPALAADLDKLIPFIEQWVDGKRLHFYSSQVGRTKGYDFGIAPDSPLHPLTYLYSGRMVLTIVMQSGNIWSYPDRRAEWFDIARGFFEQAHAAFPDNRIARMYLGEPTPWERQWPQVPGAPEWAINQRVGLEGIADIVEWWIDHRLQENGEFGGGWGDDCEMWRWWVPVLIGFHDPKITGAQAFFSNALMSEEHMRGGYTSRMTDVEHTAEDSTDAILPMMHLGPDDDVWQRRALRLAELMRDPWTGRNECGFLQFKSTYFTFNAVDDDPQKACDTPYHVRAIQPALLYWQRTRDTELTELFTAWMDTWVDATARAENGKPAGIIPAAIHWPDGGIGGLSKDWWDPRNHSEPTLYQWPSAMGAMTDALLLTYHITASEKYLEPIRSMARIRLRHIEDPQKGEPGSEAWCAARMGFLAGTIAKYRLLTGDDQFDRLLGGGASPHVAFRLTGERDPLHAALRDNARAFAHNFERYTSEVRYTDRVLRFPAVFQGDVKLAEPSFQVHSPRPELLYSTATGDPGAVGYFPMNAVRWLTSPREIAALVTDAGASRFEAELFHFGVEPREMGAELYLLNPGEYALSLLDPESDRPLHAQRVTVAGPRTRVELELPARRLCVVRIEPPR
ncbi:MAG: hypothetical protein JSV65_05760 [Armatimonadota bacterium]|nr:MAG: hypothetical protein JSV65_05760 [Armatimonadota bacterium]